MGGGVAFMREVPLFAGQASYGLTPIRGVLPQKAPKFETLKGLKLGHLPPVGRWALGGTYDF